MLCFIGAPSSPGFYVDVVPSQKENECAVFVRPWGPLSSDCPVVLFYTISYRRQGNNEWTRLNITERTTKSQEIETECSTEYEFQLVAWNKVGSSPITNKTYATKGNEMGPRPITNKTYTTKGNATTNNERGIYVLQ